MAVMAKDGSRHHSASRAQLHDELSAKKGVATVTPMKKPAGDNAAEGPKHPEPTKSTIEDHVAAHGPAHTMNYRHDQEDGTHHVSTFHGSAPGGQGQPNESSTGMDGGEKPQGHAHHSRHESHSAAHEHMSKAMGLDAGNEDRSEGEEDQTPDSQQNQMSGNRGIPGLSS